MAGGSRSGRVCALGGGDEEFGEGGEIGRRVVGEKEVDVFGGDVAAPVFSETVQQTLRLLGVQPDMAVKPQTVTKAVEESF